MRPYNLLFSTFKMDRRTDQQAYFSISIEMQFYISAMFVGFPDEMHEEKHSFFDFEQALFLDASSHLYKRVCPSVGPSVGPSVRPSVGLSVRPSVRRFVRRSVCP